MYNFILKEEETLKKIINEIGLNVDSVILIPSKKQELGQYQYNGVMELAKKLNKNPIELANTIVDKMISKDLYKSVNIAGPGFINITFKDEALIEYANYINKDININKPSLKNKKIIVDYGGANVAKALHVGHLRSANIGEALKRLSNELGNTSYGDVHLGDWGRPLGLVIKEIKETYPNLNYFDDSYKGTYGPCPITNKDLEEIYPISSLKANEDEAYMEDARIITNKIQNKVSGYYDLWKDIVEISSKDIKSIYDRLNVSFEFWYGESDSEKYIDEMIEYLTINKITKLDDGAKVIDVSKADDNSPMPPLLLIKSNGTVSYETTDLATIWGHMKNTNPDEIWYVTDQRQYLHFEQVFRAAYKSNIVSSDKQLNFLGFGTMNGLDGKPFKTRDGGTMKLIDLIELVKKETYKNIGDNIENKDLVAEQIAIACLKYADLMPNRSSDYIFDPVKFTDLNGKTGVYILYSTIRMKSLLEKAKDINYNKLSILDDIDRNILIKLLDVPKVLETSYNTKSLNYITDYLYEISNLYNNMYSNNRILTEENKDLRESRLILTNIVYQTTKKLIDILGIDVPERI